jgi:hypothetical protein
VSARNRTGVHGFGVQIGQMLWFGTFRGDRVAYRPMP